jgi:hypothetical protein
MMTKELTITPSGEICVLYSLVPHSWFIGLLRMGAVERMFCSASWFLPQVLAHNKINVHPLLFLISKQHGFCKQTVHASRLQTSFVILEAILEPKTLHMLGKCSTTELHAQQDDILGIDVLNPIWKLKPNVISIVFLSRVCLPQEAMNDETIKNNYINI